MIERIKINIEAKCDGCSKKITVEADECKLRDMSVFQDLLGGAGFMFPNYDSEDLYCPECYKSKKHMKAENEKQ